MKVEHWIGIDPSYTGLSVAVFDRVGLKVVTRPDKAVPKMRGLPRLAELKKFVQRATLAPHPFVAIEGYAFSQVNQAHAMGELGGMIRMHLWESGIPFIEVGPMTLKKFVTGMGNSKKNLMISNVLKKWGYDAKDDNDADSYSLAQFLRAYEKDPASWPTIKVVQR